MTANGGITMKKLATFFLCMCMLSVAQTEGIGSQLSDEFIDSVEIEPDGIATLKTNQVFYISLDENQSIPYRWKPDISDEKLVELIHSEPKWDRITSNMPGAPGGYRVFYFKALRAGECVIEMNYADVRDGEVLLAKTYKIVIENE
jgi:predicted secreted protein